MRRRNYRTERQASGLVGRVLGHERLRAEEVAEVHGAEPGAEAAGFRCQLDWRALQQRLELVGLKWDLAILSNLDETTGRPSVDLLAAINLQAAPGERLSAQYLCSRLRALEQGGYVTHADLSLLPLNRVYQLLPPGRSLIERLTVILGWLAGLDRQPPDAGAFFPFGELAGGGGMAAR